MVERTKTNKRVVRTDRENAREESPSFCRQRLSRLSSEVQFQAKLKLPRRVCRTGDRPELVPIANIDIRNRPNRSVRQVERLETELQSLTFGDGKLLE